MTSVFSTMNDILSIIIRKAFKYFILEGKNKRTKGKKKEWLWVTEDEAQF